MDEDSLLCRIVTGTRTLKNVYITSKKGIYRNNDRVRVNVWADAGTQQKVEGRRKGRLVSRADRRVGDEIQASTDEQVNTVTEKAVEGGGKER